MMYVCKITQRWALFDVSQLFICIFVEQKYFYRPFTHLLTKYLYRLPLLFYILIGREVLLKEDIKKLINGFSVETYNVQ